MVKKYRVELTGEERCFLETIIKKDKAAAHKKSKARLLLKIDQGKLGPAWSDSKAAEAFDYSVKAVENLRKKLVEHGFKHVLEHGNVRNSYARKITGTEEAEIIAVACGEPPAGYCRWTLRLLSEKIVELDIAEKCCKSTVGNVLKKTNLSLT